MDGIENATAAAILSGSVQKAVWVQRVLQSSKKVGPGSEPILIVKV